MTKTEIIGLVTDIARITLDEDTLAIYYSDILEEIGRFPEPPLTNIELIATVDGTSEYDLPANAVLPLAVFHNSRHLSPETVANLEAYNDGWRALTGDPYAWTRDEETGRTIKFVPEPDSDSDDFSFIHGAPFGEDFPAKSITMIFSERREDDIPDWIALYIAFRMLGREFTRPSDHQDVDFAQACDRLAEILWKIAGL